MDRFRSGQSLSPIRQAEAYWLALSEGSAVPRRTQIDPRALGNILSYAFILERIAPRLARFRLAGQHLRERAGMELRGMPFSALFTARARPDIAAALERLFDTPAIVELTMTGERRGGATRPEARAILLPLAGDDGTVNRALGVLICDNGATPPLRLDLTGQALRPVQGPARRSPAMPETGDPALPGFADAQAPLAGRPPWLRVVK